MGLLELVIVDALVVAFAAQLISEDDITEPIRDWIERLGYRHGGLFGFVNKVVSCYRCCGVWCSIFLTPLVMWIVDWPGTRWWGYYFIVALAASYGQHFLMSILGATVKEAKAIESVAQSSPPPEENQHAKEAD